MWCHFRCSYLCCTWGSLLPSSRPGSEHHRFVYVCVAAPLPADRMSDPYMQGRWTQSLSPAVVSKPPHPHLHSHSSCLSCCSLRCSRSGVFLSKTPKVIFSSTSHTSYLKPCISRKGRCATLFFFFLDCFFFFFLTRFKQVNTSKVHIHTTHFIYIWPVLPCLAYLLYVWRD